MTTTALGRPTGDKPISLSQLQAELVALGLTITDGLGMHDAHVYTYEGNGVTVDFAFADQATVNQALADHVAMRDKTDAELAAEFRESGVSAARKQEIRDMQSGLLPREQVPWTQAEWDQTRRVQ